MLGALAVLLAVTAEPVRVAVPGFSVSGIDAMSGDAYAAHLVTRVSRGSAQELSTGTFDTVASAHAVAVDGRAFEGAGVGLLIAGGAAIVASVLWLLLGGGL